MPAVVRRNVPLARRQLLHEPLKLVLALIGVALAVALVGLLLALQEGINRQATTYEDHAGADVYIGASDTRTFATPGASPLPISLGVRLGAVPGVKEAAPIANGLTILKLHDHRVATLLVGFEPGRLGGPWKMADGRPPRAASEIAVDHVMAAAHGIDVGDMVHLRGEALRVVGLTDRTASWMTPIIFVIRRTANRLQRQPDTATFFLLRAGGRSPDQLALDLARRFPRLRVMTRDRLAAESGKLVTRSFDPILRVMVLIALGIGTLVIGLTTYGFIGEHRREYGALKAIGERAGRLYRLVSAQALAIALAGLIAGVVIARLAALGIHAAWPKFLFVSLPSHYVLLVIATFAMGLIGALVPVRMLARLDPAEVFRR
jgi:putative ABC transport system permease protein